MDFSPVFQDNMKALLGKDYPEYEKCFSEKRLYGLRANRLKISPDKLKNICDFDLKDIPWIDNGFYYDGSVRPGKNPYYYAGLYYLQEPSAMTPANRIDIKPGDCVLDLCAAPGGKSTELGAKLDGKGILISNDISNSRAQALLKNIELFGISNAVVMSEAPYKLSKKLPGFFDKILIDAPCSGEGMFRKDPSVMKAWNEKSNDTYAALQREILGFAVNMLKPGGRLMYSTCTFSPKENEESVSFVLDNFPDMRLIDIEPYEGFEGGITVYGNKSPKLEKCVRIWPHKMHGEGHFLAYFEKKPSEYHNTVLPAKNDISIKELKKQTELFEFLSHVRVNFDISRINIRPNGSVTYLPENMPDLSGLRLMRTGLLLGEIKKNRFEPSQALAMSLKDSQFDNCISFSADDPNTIKYLKGETIDIDGSHSLKNGWCLVCVEHYPLGFAKLNGCTLKNKYLSGWRWQ